MKENVRVLIVDDHAVVRSGLSAFFLAFDDLQLVGEADSGEAALLLCEQTQPDVVLMDLAMPGIDGATATRLIRSRHPEVQVIVLTSFKEQELVEGAIEAGAIGYLLKNASVDELVSAIRSAAAGKPALAPEATQALIHARLQREEMGEELTEREKEVLGLMIRGLNNTEIAEKLFISRSTAKFHVSSILAKLNATSRTEAVARAVQMRLVN